MLVNNHLFKLPLWFMVFFLDYILITSTKLNLFTWTGQPMQMSRMNHPRVPVPPVSGKEECAQILFVSRNRKQCHVLLFSQRWIIIVRLTLCTSLVFIHVKIMGFITERAVLTWCVHTSWLPFLNCFSFTQNMIDYDFIMTELLIRVKRYFCLKWKLSYWVSSCLGAVWFD